MTDEQNTEATPAEPTPAPTPEQPPAQPVDAPNPHPVDEDPEQHMGEATKDPWNDESQTDWPNGSVDYPGVSS